MPLSRLCREEAGVPGWSRGGAAGRNVHTRAQDRTMLTDSSMLQFPTLFIAQDGGAGRPTDSASAVAPGTQTPSSPAAPGGGGPFSDLFFPMLIGFVFLMIIISITGSRRERKRHEAMINSVRKHDRVQTRGGIIGSVVEIKGETIILKVDESTNTRITFHRSAIASTLTSERDQAEETASS